MTLLKGTPRHEAVWQPTRDFVDRDGTLTQPFYEYIRRNDLLLDLRRQCEEN